jgi:hypothetical protein
MPYKITSIKNRTFTSVPFKYYLHLFQVNRKIDHLSVVFLNTVHHFSVVAVVPYKITSIKDRTFTSQTKRSTTRREYNSQQHNLRILRLIILEINIVDLSRNLEHWYFNTKQSTDRSLLEATY